MSTNTHCLKGTITVPGDKSISHRAVMFASLAKGTTTITNFLTGEDCLSTISCFEKLGVEIQQKNGMVIVKGNGLHGLKEYSGQLDVGNSGTTTRLISGILAAQPFVTRLNGDASIQTRPMRRIMEPLKSMGASITSLKNNDCAPLQIEGCNLHGINYTSKIASAQVKSCILLAGLYAEGNTSVTEPYLSRNHTEIMLRSFGANIITKDTTTTILPEPILTACDISVPGDISSAAYFIVAALITPNSDVLIKNVGINPTRDGIIQVATEMGGDVTLHNMRSFNGEPVADIQVKYSQLHGIEIGGEIIPTLIDEIPIIAIMAAFAEGTTTIKDASELKVKESNRIDLMVHNLKSMGADIEGTDDGMILNGVSTLNGTTIETLKDHRIAMSFAIANIRCLTPCEIIDADCVKISYPTFYDDLESLLNK